MYKITVKNLETGVKFVEYGFSRFLMKRLAFLYDREIYEIIWIDKLCKTWSTFKKCLISEVRVIE